MNKKIFIVTSILIAVFMGEMLISRVNQPVAAEVNQEKSQKKSPEVQVVPVTQATMASTLGLTGSVEPFRTAQLASPAEGPVTKVNVREADRVKTGDVLVSIGRTKGADALVLSLQEELQKEEDNTRRTRQLVKDDALPGEQLDQAKTNLEKIRAQLIKARETVLDYSVIAPWNGIVSRLIVKDGAFVAPRAALLEMYDPTSLVIRSAVPEKYASGMKTDMPVTVTLDAYPKGTFPGIISRVYPYLDTRLRTRTIEITLDKSVDLLPGMFARVTVQTRIFPGALIVPASALVPAPSGKQAVFVADNGKAFKRLVETGLEEGQRVQIISGVNPGDQVIATGNENLKDGDAIRVAEEKKQQEGGK
jgi:membrane fusion protein, multidrug efflux system